MEKYSDNFSLKVIDFFSLKLLSMSNLASGGVTKFVCARGKMQVGAPMFEPHIARKQMHCIKEYTCDIVGSFQLLQ